MTDYLAIRELASGYKLECDLTGTSVRLDARGRWSSFRIGGAFYRRCVDGSVVWGKESIRFDQEKSIRIYNIAKHWLHNLGDRVSITEDRKLWEVINKAGLYRTSDYLGLRDLYNEVYPEPVPILPPDRYRDIVVQPAIGCPNRRCNFCAFYKDKPFAVIKKPDFEQHINGVISLLGLSEIKARGGLFIGSANAMALSQRRLAECLDVIDKKLGTFQRGIAAFSDPDFSAPRTQADWQALADRNMQRVVIGLETGWGELRAKLGKSGCLLKVKKAVYAMKRAGIPVGITVLAGVCQLSEVNQHINETLFFLQSLELNQNSFEIAGQPQLGRWPAQ